MDWTGLKLLLEGIEPGKQRKRYRLPESVKNSPPNASSNSQSLIKYTDASSAAHEATERG
jgi:hypothetical protein